MEHEIPHIYLFIYSKLKEKAWNDEYLPTNIVLQTITQDCKPSKLPHNLLYHMLSQMEEYGLIKRIHKLKYKIIENKDALNEIDLYLDTKKRKSFPNVKFTKKDEFQIAINNINKGGKIHVEEDCLYKILPSKELKKLNELNCWFVKA